MVDRPVPLSMVAEAFFNVAPFRISASNWERLLLSFKAAGAILKFGTIGGSGGGGGGGARSDGIPSDIFFNSNQMITIELFHFFFSLSIHTKSLW